MRLEVLERIVQKKGDKIRKLYQTAISLYMDSDYGFQKLSPDVIEIIFKSKPRSTQKKTAKTLKDLPDVVTIYRGGNSASTPYDESFSWTLDVCVATFFAVRAGEGPAYIAMGHVKKEGILERIDDRSEQEIIVNPANVKIDGVLQLKGKDFLDIYSSSKSPIKKKYQEYERKLHGLTFVMNSDNIHGEKHELRVLFLVLLIANLLELDKRDINILATAAIYYDTQRTTEEIEPEHGKGAKDYYHNSVAKPDPLVEFLCEYHSLPDEDGYQAIENDQRLSKDKEHVILLYNVFKDADGLDRVRLGMLNQRLDINQLRLDVSKTLPLIAQLLYLKYK